MKTLHSGFPLNEDSLLEIILFLSFRDINNFALINHSCHKFTVDWQEYIYKHLLRIYFPQSWEVLLNDNTDLSYVENFTRLARRFNLSCLEIFRAAYANDASIFFSPNEIRLIDFSKKNLEKLDALQVANMKKNQAFLDGAYDFINKLLPSKTAKKSFKYRAPLFLAIACNQIKVVQNILAEDPSLIDDYQFGLTATHLAIHFNNDAMLSVLLTYDPDSFITNSPEYTPFLYACRYNKLQAAEMLYQKDPKVLLDIDPYENTPLHIAATHGYSELLEFILKQNSSLLNARNVIDETALHLAIKNRRLACVQLLLAYNANPNLKDIHDLAPLQIAIEHRKLWGIVELLLKATVFSVQRNPVKKPSSLKIIFDCIVLCKSKDMNINKLSKLKSLIFALEDTYNTLQGVQKNSINYLLHGGGIFSEYKPPYKIQWTPEKKRKSAETDYSIEAKSPTTKSRRSN